MNPTYINDFKKFSLGVGPMSQDIIDICLEYSAQYNFPLMIIPSRNQVDSKSGYVCKTVELTNKIKTNKYYDPNRILICRDHCGPYFSDLDSNLNLDQTVSRCIETIEKDIESQFDLIHIDVGRTPYDHQERIADKLFTYALKLNPNLFFEFGSEDNTGNLDNTLLNIDQQINFALNYKSSIKFLVSQTGSLTKEKQVGNFLVNNNTKLAEKMHNAGFLFKEHNADYLEKSEVILRKQTGIDALNIAPQLGTIQSLIIQELGKNFTKEYTIFYNYVLSKNYWKKWVSLADPSDDLKFVVSAHYCFSSKEYLELFDLILKKDDKFYKMLKIKLFKELDNYRLGYE